MQPLNKVLGKILKDAGLEGGAAIVSMRKRWDRMVGEGIAQHTYPDTIKNKVLTIIVDTPQWMHHLSFYKTEIIDKVSMYAVSEVRFRIGRLPDTADKE